MSKCKTPDCDRKPVSRGCCSACYQSHWRQIKLGETTWDDLVSKDLINPKRGRESKARKAVREAAE